MTRRALPRVRYHLDQSWALPLEQRKAVAGLPPERADVILNGGGNYAAVFETFDPVGRRVTVSRLRYAALMGP